MFSFTGLNFDNNKKQVKKKKKSWKVGVYLEELCVDFKLWYRTSLLLGGPPALFNALEEVVDSTGDDTQLFVCYVDIEASPHGVRLP